MNAQVAPNSINEFSGINFPDNAKGVLQKLGDFYQTCKRTGIPWNPEIFIGDINLFVYNLVNCQDIKRTKLRLVQQLCLADIVLVFLSEFRDDNDRFDLFQTIFYITNLQKGDVPLEILKKVSSLAVAFQNIAFLDSLSLWMTTIGLDNPSVVAIAMNLSKDFVTDEFPDKYNYLPEKAYRLTVEILVVIGKAFRNASPPKQLIILVATWIESTPRVCFSSQQTSVFDLFRWCIHPFHENELDKSRLHLALMTAINKEGKGSQLQALPEIRILIQELKFRRDSVAAANHYGEIQMPSQETVDKAVDSLLQLIQMFISAQCLEIRDIRNIFDSMERASLPRTEFLQLMKTRHLKDLFLTFREPKLLA